MQVGNQSMADSDGMEVTKRAGDCLLSLPLYYEMTDKEVMAVRGSVHEFYQM